MLDRGAEPGDDACTIAEFHQCAPRNKGTHGRTSAKPGPQSPATYAISAGDSRPSEEALDARHRLIDRDMRVQVIDDHPLLVQDIDDR
jgi:hypothetical protein